MQYGSITWTSVCWWPHYPCFLVVPFAGQLIHPSQLQEEIHRHGMVISLLLLLGLDSTKGKVAVSLDNRRKIYEPIWAPLLSPSWQGDQLGVALLQGMVVTLFTWKNRSTDTRISGQRETSLRPAVQGEHGCIPFQSGGWAGLYDWLIRKSGCLITRESSFLANREGRRRVITCHPAFWLARQHGFLTSLGSRMDRPCDLLSCSKS